MYIYIWHVGKGVVLPRLQFLQIHTVACTLIPSAKRAGHVQCRIPCKIQSRKMNISAITSMTYSLPLHPRRKTFNTKILLPAHGLVPHQTSIGNPSLNFDQCVRLVRSVFTGPHFFARLPVLRQRQGLAVHLATQDICERVQGQNLRLKSAKCKQGMTAEKPHVWFQKLSVHSSIDSGRDVWTMWQMIIIVSIVSMATVVHQTLNPKP